VKIKIRGGGKDKRKNVKKNTWVGLKENKLRENANFFKKN